MEVLHPHVERYMQGLLADRDPVVLEMERYAEATGFPIVGPLVGRLLAMVARTISAQRVFELGSGLGYSSYWFAVAMGPHSSVVHTELSRDTSARAESYLARLGLRERVTFECGDALHILQRYHGPFDIIFCDIDKARYPSVPELAIPRLRSGGLLIIDNTLWHTHELGQENDVAARGVDALNRLLHSRDDVATVIVPIRDGVSISLKL